MDLSRTYEGGGGHAAGGGMAKALGDGGAEHDGNGKEKVFTLTAEMEETLTAEL